MYMAKAIYFQQIQIWNYKIQIFRLHIFFSSNKVNLLITKNNNNKQKNSNSYVIGTSIKKQVYFSHPSKYSLLI